MILRRIVSHLKQQQGTAVGVELVIVILGVFIGTQVSNREAFRMSLPTPVQRALGKYCGDRPAEVGDYASIANQLDYACSTGLSAQVIAESARALRGNSDMLPLLRLRIADLDTRLVDLTGNNRSILASLRRIAGQKP